MFCINCGRQIADGAKFCVNCGAPVASIPDGAAKQLLDVSSQIAAGGADSTSSIIAGVGEIARAAGAVAARSAGVAVQTKVMASAIALAIIIAGIVLYNMFFVVKPMEIVEKFIVAINEKDINTAVACLDPKYERAYNAASNIVGGFIGVSIKDFADLLPVIFDTAKLNDPSVQDLYINIVQVVSEETKGNEARIIVALDARDGPGGKLIDSGNCIFYLSRFNAEWRIVDIKDVPSN